MRWRWDLFNTWNILNSYPFSKARPILCGANANFYDISNVYQKSICLVKTVTTYATAKNFCAANGMKLYIAVTNYDKKAVLNFSNLLYANGKKKAGIIIDGANTTHCKSVNNYGGNLAITWRRRINQGCSGYFYCEYINNSEKGN